MKCPLCSSPRKERWAEANSSGSLYYRCEVCRLTWLSEHQRLSPAEEKARYETHQNQLSEQYMAYLGQLALPLAARLTPPARGLDFGCGPTEGMKGVLSPLGFSVDSYDPYFFPRPELLKNHYDFVLCSEAMEHFFDPAAECELLAKLVRPGGWLAVSSLLAPREPAAFLAWWYRRDPTHVSFYAEETVGWIAKRWGFEVAELNSPRWYLRKL